MADSIFTKIIKGEIPSYKIYEDDKIIAILDIHPAKLGHTLVITKAQVDKFTDLKDDDYMALWAVVKTVSKRLLSVLKTDRVRVSIVGTDVPHVHVHLIPFNESDKTVNQNLSSEPDQAALAEMAQKLRF